MITLKGIIIFAGGAAVGALTSWYYSKRKYERIIEENEATAAEYYKEQYLGVDAFVEDDEEEVSEGDVEVPSKPERKGSFATDYTSFYKEVPTDPVVNEHPEDDGETKVSSKRPPKIIKMEDFGSNGYSEVYLEYYTQDGALVIADETEAKEIDEVKDFIGNALEKYGFDHNDEERIYVRNFDRKCDYMIQKIWDKFSPDEGDY